MDLESDYESLLIQDMLYEQIFMHSQFSCKLMEVARKILANKQTPKKIPTIIESNFGFGLSPLSMPIKPVEYGTLIEKKEEHLEPVTFTDSGGTQLQSSELQPVTTTTMVKSDADVTYDEEMKKYNEWLEKYEARKALSANFTEAEKEKLLSEAVDVETDLKETIFETFNEFNASENAILLRLQQKNVVDGIVKEALSNVNNITKVINSILISPLTLLNNDLKEKILLELLKQISQTDLKERAEDHCRAVYAAIIANPKYNTNNELQNRALVIEKILGINPEVKEQIKNVVPATDNEDHGLATRIYCLIEKDPEKQKNFAIQQLSKFSAGSKGILDDKESTRVKKGLTDIMTAVAPDKDKTLLKQHAGKIVRDATIKCGKKMSWSQIFKKAKDEIISTFYSIFNNKLSIERKQLITQYSEILKKAMKQSGPQKTVQKPSNNKLT